MAKKRKPGFDEWYGDLYDTRWPAIREALKSKPVYTDLSRYLKKPYYLDEASLIAAECLEVRPGHTVLDMCAAPGGKTLVLALALGGAGSLVANDRSSARRARLRRVLDEHLPEELRKIVTITGHDAARWGLHEQDVYDRILLDAPCSSERHVVNSPTHLAKWSPARTRHLSVQAYAMLASAYIAVKPGGLIVYSTCSLSPLENDQVVEKLMKKRDARISLIDIRIGEQTPIGRQIVPDRDGGRGPMYIAKIRKPS